VWKPAAATVLAAPTHPTIQPALRPASAGPAAGASRERPLLVALHGWLLAGRLWEPLAAALHPGWELWAPDLPGFGDEPRPRALQPSLASYGRWLADACQRERPGRAVVLIGHSLGGSVVLHAAPHLGRRLRGVVQVAAGGGVYQPRAFAQLRRGGSLFLRWRPGWLAQLPAAAAIRSPLRADLRAARGLLACSTNRGAVRQLPALTTRLSVPSLWVAGSRDQVMTERYVRHLAGYAPAHRLARLEGAGHLPMRQMPERLAAVIETWLEQVVLKASHQVQSAARPRS
jgi:2-succinyl-6-hydroxy-2,4-cyclohexadiene-1-carboxylate synthase